MSLIVENFPCFFFPHPGSRDLSPAVPGTTQVVRRDPFLLLFILNNDLFEIRLCVIFFFFISPETSRPVVFVRTDVAFTGGFNELRGWRFFLFIYFVVR